MRSRTIIDSDAEKKALSVAESAHECYRVVAKSLFAESKLPFSVGAPGFSYNLPTTDSAGGERTMVNRSSQQKKPARLHEVSSLHPVEVHPARQSAPVELHLVIACVLLAILQECNVLAERVEHV
jgi:hypothetical protein